MNARIQFVYELCGSLLIVFTIIGFITVIWNWFVTVNFVLFATIVFAIRRYLEWRYGELWKNSLQKLFMEDENGNKK